MPAAIPSAKKMMVRTEPVFRCLSRKRPIARPTAVHATMVIPREAVVHKSVISESFFFKNPSLKFYHFNDFKSICA